MTPREKVVVRATLYPEDIEKAEKVLIDNGIESDEADTVLQALGYVLFNDELYEE